MLAPRVAKLAPIWSPWSQALQCFNITIILSRKWDRTPQTKEGLRERKLEIVMSWVNPIMKNNFRKKQLSSLNELAGTIIHIYGVSLHLISSEAFRLLCWCCSSFFSFYISLLQLNLTPDSAPSSHFSSSSFLVITCTGSAQLSSALPSSHPILLFSPSLQASFFLPPSLLPKWG